MEIILSILNSDALLAIIPLVMIINALLSGVSLTLEKLVVAGQVKPDSKVVTTVAKIAGVLKTIVDFLSANRKH